MSVAYCIDCFEMDGECQCGNPSGAMVFGERRLNDLIDRGLRPIEKDAAETMQNFFDLDEKIKKKIMENAAVESNRAQKDLQDSSGIIF